MDRRTKGRRKPYRPRVAACLDCGAVRQMDKQEKNAAARPYCPACGGTVVESRFHPDASVRKRANDYRRSRTPNPS